jgi:hypothetical protein
MMSFLFCVSIRWIGLLHLEKNKLILPHQSFPLDTTYTYVYDIITYL